MLRRTLLMIPIFAVSIYACDDHAHEEEEGVLPAGYEDAVIVGTATDEALVAFASALDQGAPAADPARAAVLDAPAADAVLPKATPAAFSWHFGTSAMQNNSNELPTWGFPGPKPQIAASSAFLSPLRELIGPVRAARAHGDPFTGTATWLVFSTDADPRLLRVFTSDTAYTPDAAAWTKLSGAGKAIKLSLSSAEFENNRIVQGGGPIAGGSIQFTIGP